MQQQTTRHNGSIVAAAPTAPTANRGNGGDNTNTSEHATPTDTTQQRLRIAIGIATVGRPEILHQTLVRLSRQTRTPDAIVVCSPSPDDVSGVANAHANVTTIKGPRGSSHQRNTILEHLKDYDAVAFFDDDFIPDNAYISNVEKILVDNPEIVVTTGHVLEDGILGPGLTFDQADHIISSSESAPATPAAIHDVFNGYGCNMVARIAPIRQNNVTFDERLPLYAWLEDVDFSRQLAPSGRIVKTSTTRGVHLGVKRGRQPGVRLGYSQIANPIFLIRKGTCSWSLGLFLMSRNIAANLAKALRPEPWVDRKGRVFGNARAIWDLLTGRLRPDRVLSL